MKKRVNISKLIEEKYKDDTFSFKQLNEMIDSLLDEGLENWQGKIDTGNLEELSQGEDVFDHTYGMGGAENPVAKKELPINADKIAEQGKPEAKQYTLQVPDIFSMITNSEMKVGDDDRKLIGGIVRNIQPGKGFWRLRVNAINDFVTRNKQNAISEVSDIRSAISSLIMLNVLKKLAFFTAQPGKLFEYVFAPIIGTQAKVVGSTDTSIIDLTKESQNEIWNYSLKFFTGDDSSYLVKGSAKNLKEVVLQKDRPVTYILASATKEGTKSKIEFAELLISTEPYHFPKSEGWKVINVYDNGQLLVGNGTCGILVIKKEDYEQLATAGQLEPLDKDIQKRTRGLQPGTPQVRKITGLYFDNKNKPLSTNVDVVEANIDKLQNNLEKLKPLISEPEKLKTLMTKGITSNSLSDPKNVFNIAMTDVLSDLTRSANSAYSKQTPGDILKQWRELGEEDKIQKFNKLISDAEGRLEQLKNAVQAPVKEAIEQQAQEPEKKKEVNFSITLKGAWPAIPNKAVLDLGDPNEYNKQQLVMASDLADNIEKTFDAFQKLNTNLIKFFASSKEVVRAAGESDETFANNQKKAISDIDNAGTEAIKNAETIQTNVTEFQKKEKA
jgi:hypothetical protein